MRVTKDNERWSHYPIGKVLEACQSIDRNVDFTPEISDGVPIPIGAAEDITTAPVRVVRGPQLDFWVHEAERQADV